MWVGLFLHRYNWQNAVKKRSDIFLKCLAIGVRCALKVSRVVSQHLLYLHFARHQRNNKTQSNIEYRMFNIIIPLYTYHTALPIMYYTGICAHGVYQSIETKISFSPVWVSYYSTRIFFQRYPNRPTISSQWFRVTTIKRRRSFFKRLPSLNQVWKLYTGSRPAFLSPSFAFFFFSFSLFLSFSRPRRRRGLPPWNPLSRICGTWLTQIPAPLCIGIRGRCGKTKWGEAKRGEARRTSERASERAPCASHVCGFINWVRRWGFFY